jgi:3-deoxy-D-manno-octulosonic-acid transferase
MGEWKIMIAPHNVDENYILECKTILEDKVNLYSKGIGAYVHESRFLVIDCIGLLANLYSKASLAFVGGGFGKGIHNILEPIAFGVPVCFGPHHKKFREAQIFMDNKFGFEIRRPEDLVNLAISSNVPNWRNEKKQAITKFLDDQKGSTEKIISYLEQNYYLK